VSEINQRNLRNQRQKNSAFSALSAVKNQKIFIDFSRQNCKIAGFNVYWMDSADGCFLILIQKEQVIWAVKRNR
jgi:hypothetical protein